MKNNVNAALADSNLDDTFAVTGVAVKGSPVVVQERERERIVAAGIIEDEGTSTAFRPGQGMLVSLLLTVVAGISAMF